MILVYENAMNIDQTQPCGSTEDLELNDTRAHSVPLFGVSDADKKPHYGILMKGPFFDNKKYEKLKYEVADGGPVNFKKWTMKMVKFEGDSGVLSYCDAATYQKSEQFQVNTPTVMLGKCQYFHVGARASCASVPELDNVEKSQFVFSIAGLTGVHDKTLYLATYTPDDRLKWVSRITSYTRTQQFNSLKITEHHRLMNTISTQDGQIQTLQSGLEDLVKMSGYLKSQVKKYQSLAARMREDNIMLLDKLEVVSKEISGLRSSLKQNSVSNQLDHLNLQFDENSSEQDSDFLSPEVEYLERFSKYLDFKRNDILRMSGRKVMKRPGSITSTSGKGEVDKEQNLPSTINELS